ncbi:MAG: UDP-4-amino-4,6-dideoxy-N-acetyl-beta-L-altrosamine N-acetyltransferase [Elusimicrobia bacterium ADurb.Bin231]|nr:MAG: UDP-4-amino-4,6-dideoxy-N-acetyl-beta-L-altrosamine N-acetyltransferase [Elusimicrobia bacterium ADurb.Bin231]
MTNTKIIKLASMISLDTESQLKVREIRNEENVRKWMYTDHVIGVNEHLAWINWLKQDDKQIVFVVLSEECIPMGVVSVNAIDRLHKKADWAYYLTENARGGLGSSLEYNFINFVFDTLGMDKLNCEVIEGNDAVVKLHKKFLFQEEGFRCSNILKNGVRIGVHFLELTKDDWLAGKANIQEKYRGVFEKFSVSIQWQPSEEKVSHPIDQIEAARARNNLNWMSILRLAIEKSPGTAKPIVAEIKRIDREISALTDKITGENV